MAEGVECRQLDLLAATEKVVRKPLETERKFELADFTEGTYRGTPWPAL